MSLTPTYIGLKVTDNILVYPCPKRSSNYTRGRSGLRRPSYNSGPKEFQDCIYRNVPESSPSAPYRAGSLYRRETYWTTELQCIKNSAKASQGESDEQGITRGVGWKKFPSNCPQAIMSHSQMNLGRCPTENNHHTQRKLMLWTFRTAGTIDVFSSCLKSAGFKLCLWFGLANWYTMYI